MRFLKNIGSILISLALAFLVWIAAVREQNPPRIDDYNRNIPIEVIPPAEGLTTTDVLPEIVRLRLLAPESSWINLTPSKFKASIDLSVLNKGFHDVLIHVAVSDPRVEIVEQTPSEASVNIETIQNITRTVDIEVTDSPPLGYRSRSPVADPPVVEIIGPASLVSQVDKALIEVSVRNSKETIQNLRTVLIRNREGLPIRDVEVNPIQIEITVPIEQRFGYKDVSVSVNVQGQVAPGYRVSNISVEPPTLTVVGNPQGLGEVGEVVETVPINLDGATEDIVRVVSLNLPDGVTEVTPGSDFQEGPDGVKITIEVIPIEDAITLQRPVTQQGIDPKYWWRAEPKRVEVFLSGPLPQLETLRASDVEVKVDLFGLEPGTHSLQPTVFKPDNLQVDAVLPDTVGVTIGRMLERPVTQKKLNPEYTWTLAPNRVTVQLLGIPALLNILNPNNIQVSVDLGELEPGFYRIKPIVSIPDGIELDSISPENIDVTIRPKAIPTVTSTRTVSVTLTPPAGTITPQPTKDN